MNFEVYLVSHALRREYIASYNKIADKISTPFLSVNPAMHSLSTFSGTMQNKNFSLDSWDGFFNSSIFIS